jgi:RND family efflux transporter MFP subunit
MVRTPRHDSIAAVLIAALIGATAASCRRGAPQPEAVENDRTVPVTAQAATRGSLRAVIHTTGVVAPAQGAEFIVRAPETARVVDIAKAEGEPVASGDVLARFDLAGATANVARQRAEVAGAQALAENARVAQARTRDFVERGLVARQEIDRADRELADAQAVVARAEAALGSAEAAAARAIVRAPFAGIVTNRLRNPGDLVPVQDAVMRMVDPKRLEVDASISAADVARVVQGATARVVIAAAALRLIVSSRPGSIDARTGMASARLTFVEPPAGMTVDQSVTVDIDAEERLDVVFVPSESIVRSGRDGYVFVAAGDRAERRAVTPGVETEERTEVTSGIKAGELVITQGQNALQDGDRITVNVSGRQ